MKKNALGELADELKRSLDLQMPGTSYYRDRTIFCTPEVIDKSMRIIAELTKVRTNSFGFPKKLSIPLLDDMANLYATCRAIAEEGDNNEK